MLLCSGGSEDTCSRELLGNCHPPATALSWAQGAAPGRPRLPSQVSDVPLTGLCLLWTWVCAASCGGSSVPDRPAPLRASSGTSRCRRVARPRCGHSLGPSLRAHGRPCWQPCGEWEQGRAFPQELCPALRGPSPACARFGPRRWQGWSQMEARLCFRTSCSALEALWRALLRLCR